MDEAERDRIVAELAEQATDLLAAARRERDSRRAAGEDVAWLDRFLADAEQLAAATEDADVFAAIWSVIRRHGPGPYPADELATIAARAPDAVRRVLTDMEAEGLARRAGPDEQPTT